MVVNVTPRQAWELIEKGEVTVVDVRDAHEWDRGHIPGALLVPLAQVRANPRKHLPAGRVLFVCAGGVRSQTAARIAQDHGIADVLSVIGGTTSWIKAGLPLTPPLSVAV
jgi:rhodanese-related sulfurtransferase